MAFSSGFLRTLESLDLLARRLLTGEEHADRQSMRRSASLEFADYRAYSAGDEIRYIDWNVYARHGNLFVKEFTAEENVHVGVVIDVSASMAFGSKFEAARELAAALAYIGLARFDAVSLYSVGAVLQPLKKLLRGRGAAMEMLGVLDSIVPGGATDFRAALSTPMSRFKGRSLVLLLSDFYDTGGYAEGIRALLAQRHQVHLIHLVSSEEVEPRERGRYQLVDLETGRHRDVPMTEAVLEQYRARFRAFCDDVERYALSHELYYARVRSDEPLEQRVRDILRRGGILEKK